MRLWPEKGSFEKQVYLHDYIAYHLDINLFMGEKDAQVCTGSISEAERT